MHLMLSHEVMCDKERRAMYQACEIITDDYRLLWHYYDGRYDRDTYNRDTMTGHYSKGTMAGTL